MRRAGATVLAALVCGAPVLLARPAAADAPCQQQEQTGAPLPASAPRDPMIARLGLERAWRLSTGRGVTVAVFDSGLNKSHQPKLAPAVLPGYELSIANNKAGYTVAAFGGGRDCDRAHGTSVASLIAARPGDDNRVVGVAPDAKILPIRSVDQIGRVPDTLLAQGIRLAADHADIINLSWATPNNYPAVQQAISYALRRNRIVIAAANNEQSEPGVPFYPAAYTGVLAVNAVDRNGAPRQKDNHEQWIGIAAPGQGLTVLAADHGFIAVDGTSYATAIVSGVAALVRARFPTMPAAEVVRRLKGTAVPLGALADQVGAGMVDPFAALTGRVAAVDPAASASPPAAGSIRVQARPEAPKTLGERWGRMFRWAGVLGLAAVLAYLARLAVRAALRRRWRAGEVQVAEESPYQPTLHPPNVRLL
jgi:membrane-anchored mycosin MYCP